MPQHVVSWDRSLCSHYIKLDQKAGVVLGTSSERNLRVQVQATHSDGNGAGRLEAVVARILSPNFSSGWNEAIEAGRFSLLAELHT